MRTSGAPKGAPLFRRREVRALGGHYACAFLRKAYADTIVTLSKPARHPSDTWMREKIGLDWRRPVRSRHKFRSTLITLASFACMIAMANSPFLALDGMRSAPDVGRPDPLDA
jgi:hypothetical protein